MKRLRVFRIEKRGGRVQTALCYLMVSRQAFYVLKNFDCLGSRWLVCVGYLVLC